MKIHSNHTSYRQHASLPARGLRIVSGIVLCAALVFVGYQVRGIVFGPRITLAEDITWLDGANGSVEIAGTSTFTTELFINGIPVLITPEGQFSYHLTAPPGLSLITLEARDRYGKHTIKEIPLSRPYALPWRTNDTRATGVALSTDDEIDSLFTEPLESAILDQVLPAIITQ
jgi:hypothetical protein